MKFTVNGGTFENFNPEAPETNDMVNLNGNKVVDNGDGSYTVQPNA